ncbi:IclR family pca regulon transcriptional regulator [Mycoplana sp. BE70]|uniref:IclR family transcriptional regulator n=1 Tax=Mycoplana sp. BE70 TaxID=2817775 RepID=UPI0028607327|nr:IclR family transcriptional regulator [Mycoplana sp. BE70]MDR6759256.1 IclR family pca regulon transcriptional regulator [Mycoplana sp. BE70]
MREADFVSGFARGLKVIEAFGEMHQRLSITDAAKLSGLDRATVRRSLLTLAELGYAAYDGKFFTLTPKTLRLGHAYLSATPLPAILQPHLDTLSEKADQSASASVLDGTEILYIARASNRRVMSINLNPGSQLPAYCTSMGRVLLASLPKAEVRAILARTELRANTPQTITDQAQLLAEFERVRDQGYAVIDQELELGLCSIAVPVENDRGQLICAVNIGAPAAHASAEEMVTRFLPLLRETQAALRVLLR